MKDFPIRNIFLPATLVGTSIFSIMAFTLPTFIDQHSLNERAPRLGVRSSLDLTGIHKELVITYIGSAIVMSASAGLGAAELLRKRAVKKSNNSNLKSALAEFVDHHSQQSVTDLEVQFSALIAEHIGDPSVDNQAPMEPGTEIASPAAIDTRVSAAVSDSLWQMPSPAVEPSQAEPEEFETDSTIMIFPGQYLRCRIQVPDSPEQQYAIEFDHQFYSLLSSGVSQEQALAAVNQLAQEERAAILTRMNQGYAVWVLEPNAEVVSVA